MSPAARSSTARAERSRSRRIAQSASFDRTKAAFSDSTSSTSPAASTASTSASTRASVRARSSARCSSAARPRRSPRRAARPGMPDSARSTASSAAATSAAATTGSAAVGMTSRRATIPASRASSVPRSGAVLIDRRRRTAMIPHMWAGHRLRRQGLGDELTTSPRLIGLAPQRRRPAQWPGGGGRARPGRVRASAPRP